MPIKPLLVFILTSLFLSSCAVKSHKNISYLDADHKSSITQPTLNVFTPKSSKFENNPVLIFVHGGNWNAGKKEIYGFLGRNFAKKGITTVIVGYTLSPNANYADMANQIAQAISWTKSNITNYKGNANSIFLTGHSAGGHLVALVGTNPNYLKDKEGIKGIILNDAAGLDMFNYLNKNPPTNQNDYLTTWTADPNNWKDASPIYYLNSRTPPLMIYLGKKTYESIKEGNARFVEKLHELQPQVKPIVLNKKHVPMMTQYFFPWSNRYDEILQFMSANK